MLRGTTFASPVPYGTGLWGQKKNPYSLARSRALPSQPMLYEQSVRGSETIFSAGSGASFQHMEALCGLLPADTLLFTAFF